MKQIIPLLFAIIIVGCSSAPAPEVIVVTATSAPTDTQEILQTITNPFEMTAEDVARIMNDRFGYSFEWVAGDGFYTEVESYGLKIGVKKGGLRTDNVSTLILESRWYEPFPSSTAGLLLSRLEMGRLVSELDNWLRANSLGGETYTTEYFGAYKIGIQYYFSLDDSLLKLFITLD